MPTPLENAISYFQEEADSYLQGTKAQPADGSAEWYMLRASMIGLQYLRRIQTLEIHTDPAACERLYLKGGAMFKTTDVPPPIFVEKEVISSV